MSIPFRPRRLRTKESIRKLVQEHHITANDFMYPLFVKPGKGIREPISSLPGQARLSIDELLKEAEESQKLGIPSILIFGVENQKDENATYAYNESGTTQEAIRALRKNFPDLYIAVDVCVCAYTTHGHCGIVADGKVLNDPTLEILGKTAVSYAAAGADMVAPSAMMDGQVGAIRTALDENGFAENVAIMAYAAKYYSAFYGPFREAADSAPQFGNRAAYQMDKSNAREALREIRLDLEEGADVIMVKPAMTYMDIIYQARQITDVPIAAYNVSGEYAAIKAAAANGWLNEEQVVIELMHSFKRAGTDIIITYFAKQVAQYLQR